MAEEKHKTITYRIIDVTKIIKMIAVIGLITYSGNKLEVLTSIHATYLTCLKYGAK